MRESEDMERTFKNYLKYGYVVGPLIMYLIMTPMISLIVSSLVLFIIFTLLLFLQLLIGWRVWENGVDLDAHHRVMGFLLIFNFGLHAVMPFFFISFGTIFFYISLAIYLLLLGFLFTKTKAVAEGINNPSKSLIGKAFLIGAGVIIFVAIPAHSIPREGLIIQLLDDKMKGFYIITAMYLIGLLITFILPVFFYPVQTKAEELEELPKGRRKLSRAKRKALKAKKVNKNAKTDIS
jgi:hypothetical protein